MIRAKHGDSSKTVTLTKGAAVLDLTDATEVEYHFVPRPGDGALVSGVCELVDQPAGQVAFPIPAVGRYDAEWQVTYGSGAEETVPTGLPEVLVVYPDLGD